MEIIEIKPAAPILLKPPSTLKTEFVLCNLTLHSVCVFILPIHQDILCLSPSSVIIQAFQQITVDVILHWNQHLKQNFKSKLRVYIWENYDEIGEIQQIEKIMFSKETDGNCLMFEQISIHFELDQHFLRPLMAENLPEYYFLKRLKLPNDHKIKIDEEISGKVLQHSEKLGKVKGIYTYGEEYVIQFSHLTQVLSSFCQIRDDHDQLILYAIGCLPSYGHPLQSLKVINHGLVPQKKFRNKKGDQNKQKQEQGFEHHHHYHNPKSHNKSVKQSFMVSPNQSKTRRRNKSAESISIPIFEEQEDQSNYMREQSNPIDIGWIKQYRKGQNFKIDTMKVYKQSMIEIPKRVLNIKIGQFEGETWIFLLLPDSILVCDTNNIANKWKIKFEPLDKQATLLPTPMILTKSQIIFGNESYLYWVSLKGNFSTWKYVQRKQIYCLELIEELNLLIVGGKTFSKLSYLGKSTHRSNIKVYNGGKTDKYEHLFTYDIPNCSKDHVTDLNYITTKPSGTKLLMVLTSSGIMTFLRVRSYNEIQLFSQMNCMEIGIQQIISLKYCPQSNHLVCLEKLDKKNHCFKNIKVNCSYQKVQLSTEGLKLPVKQYIERSFTIGYDKLMNSCWMTVIDTNGDGRIYWVQSKQFEGIETSGNIKSCLQVQNGFIFEEKTSIRYKLLK